MKILWALGYGFLVGVFALGPAFAGDTNSATRGGGVTDPGNPAMYKPGRNPRSNGRAGDAPDVESQGDSSKPMDEPYHNPGGDPAMQPDHPRGYTAPDDID